jgi:threonine aldolase
LAPASATIGGVTIELRSDNAAGVAPEIMAAIAAANAGGVLAYGGDPLTAQLEALVREVFDHPGARVFPVASGTAANALALSTMCPPWGLVFCHDTAHILNSECGSTSMFGGGAVMRGVGGNDFLIDADRLAAAYDSVRWDDNHASQPRVLSLTQATDRGTIYTVDHVAALAELATRHGSRVHIDGARLANAVAALGCSPADLTWRAGVSALSLGAIKNGAMSADAIVTFDGAIADELVYRTKRAGHVTSKMRFQSAQLIAYLTDGLWLRLAGHANAAMRRLSDGLVGLGVTLLNRPDVNMVFAEVSDPAMEQLWHAGVDFYDITTGVARFVTSWQTTDADVDRALELMASALR